MTVAEWVRVEPGRAELGSQNRSILFGGIGPRHMVEIGYGFEISRNPVEAGRATELLEEDGCELASESEWQLALDRGAITGSDELELLAERFGGDYWGKFLDGRPMLVDDWVFRIVKQWKAGRPSTHLNSQNSQEQGHSRLVRRDENVEFSADAARLPLARDTAKLIREEVTIILLAGIIPSFAWAYFNASQEYLKTGWPGLIMGGVVLGLVTAIFWRPKTTSYRIGRNCGKVKPNN
jgi:hypothetical protein